MDGGASTTHLDMDAAPPPSLCFVRRISIVLLVEIEAIIGPKIETIDP
jgi:hypothetical protein